MTKRPGASAAPGRFRTLTLKSAKRMGLTQSYQS
jgi:hypothetical protein